MDIKLDMYLPFMTAFNELRERYGDEFLSLNGFANRNLNFTDFINNFVDSDNVANATIDSNANANMKDICSLLSEIDKPHTKLLAYNKIFYELTKKYGLRTAKEWLEAEWNGAFYLHDAYSASFKPYSYTADQTFYIEHLDEQQKVSFEQFYDMVDVPESYDYENDMFYKDLTNEQYYIEDNADLKATVKSILGKRSKKTQITRVMKHKNTRPIHRITLEDKTSIVVTNDHPIITETETKASRFVRYGEKIWSNTSNDWVGVSTNRVINGYFPEIVYDITTSTGTFICQEQYCHNCYAIDVEDLAKKGLYFIPDYNSEAPKHLMTYVRDILELVSFQSNRTSGACGLPNVLVYFFYFWKKDVEDGYFLRSPEYYMRQGV